MSQTDFLQPVTKTNGHYVSLVFALLPSVVLYVQYVGINFGNM
jgi:hypothetical protein